ncbi:hypothetical protein [Streptomyces halstedii]|uniref:hypothetical protein n=1 Tax=Streptomyces halstedii TaxID=1944 RepID=UPI0038026D65
MPRRRRGEPSRRGHVVEYLTDHEQRYGPPVQRPVRVRAVRRDGSRPQVETDAGPWSTPRPPGALEEGRADSGGDASRRQPW